MFINTLILSIYTIVSGISGDGDGGIVGVLDAGRLADFDGDGSDDSLSQADIGKFLRERLNELASRTLADLHQLLGKQCVVDCLFQHVGGGRRTCVQFQGGGDEECLGDRSLGVFASDVRATTQVLDFQDVHS